MSDTKHAYKNLRINGGESATIPPEPVALPKHPAKVSNLPVRDGRTADPQPARTEWLTDAQLRYVQKLISETCTDIDQLLAYFGFDSLDSIPKSEVNRVIKALQSKRKVHNDLDNQTGSGHI